MRVLCGRHSKGRTTPLLQQVFEELRYSPVSSLMRREAFSLKVAAAVLIYRPYSDLFIRVEKPAFQKAVWIALAVWLSGLSACL